MRRKTTKRSERPRQNGGTAIIWPRGLRARYGISASTQLYWEKHGKLPPRDVFIGGKAAGWKPTTLDKADAGAL